MNEEKTSLGDPAITPSGSPLQSSEDGRISAAIPIVEEVRSKSYTLRSDNGAWLAQVVLTSDGMFASVTDWGNLSYAWRNYGENDFRKFLITLSEDYFGSKLFTGMAYILSGRKCEEACMRFAKKILPALKAELRKELAEEALTKATQP